MIHGHVFSCIIAVLYSKSQQLEQCSQKIKKCLNKQLKTCHMLATYKIHVCDRYVGVITVFVVVVAISLIK